MKKYHFLLLMVTFLWSCQDAEESELSAEVNYSLILEEAVADVSSDLTAIYSTKGSLAMVRLFELLEKDGLLLEENGQEDQSGGSLELSTTKLLSKITSLSSLGGTYSWDRENQKFIRVDSEHLEVRFPFDGAEINNAELVFTELIFIDSDSRFPGAVMASLSVDNEEVGRLNMEIEWSTNELPISATLLFELLPYSLTLNFDDTFEQKATLLASISNDESIVSAIDLSLEFTSEVKEEIMSLTGGFQYNLISMDGQLDLQNLDQAENLDDIFDLTIYNADDQIGVLGFRLDEVSNEHALFIEFVDETSVNVCDLTAPLVEQFEWLISNY